MCQKSTLCTIVPVTIHFLVLFAVTMVSTPHVASADLLVPTHGEQIAALGASITGFDIDPKTNKFYFVDVTNDLLSLEDGAMNVNEVAILKHPLAAASPVDMRFHPSTGNLFVLFQIQDWNALELWEYDRQALAVDELPPLRVSALPIPVGSLPASMLASNFTFLGDNAILIERADSLIAFDPAANEVLRTYPVQLTQDVHIGGIAYDRFTDSLVYSRGNGMGFYDLENNTHVVDRLAHSRLFDTYIFDSFDEVAMSLDGMTAYFTTAEYGPDLYAVHRSVVPEPASIAVFLGAVMIFGLLGRRNSFR